MLALPFGDIKVVMVAPNVQDGRQVQSCVACDVLHKPSIRLHTFVRLAPDAADDIRAAEPCASDELVLNRFIIFER